MLMERIYLLTAKAYPEASEQQREITAVTQFTQALRNRQTAFMVGMLAGNQRLMATKLDASATVYGMEKALSQFDQPAREDRAERDR